jgi:glycosyltransferase involved in cell wall biosynthesis
VKSIKLAYLVSHPIQYQAPLLRLVARQPEIDMTVFFCSKISLNEFIDPEFNKVISWDVPLLEGYQHQFLPTLGADNTLSFVSPIVYGLKRQLIRGNFDALWVHGWGRWSHLWAIATAHRLGLKVLVRGETGLHLDSSSVIKKWAKHCFMKWLISKVDGFLAIGTQNREFYHYHGAESHRLYHVPYAVDNTFFQKRAHEASGSREQLRHSLELEPGRPIILYASKLTPRKRANDLLEAYIRLSGNGRAEPRPYLLIIGDGQLSADLRKRAHETGWNSIKFLGFKNQTELPGYYDLCDVFVLPSAKEPWGLVVNEAMNAGKPIIVSDQVGSAPDLVKHGANGFIFKTGDIEDLKRYLQIITNDPGLCEKLGNQSIRIINTWNFDSDLLGIRAALGLEA